MCKYVWPGNLSLDSFLFFAVFHLQDPVKDGEAKIKQDFSDLVDEMQQGFRNLED